ncbi:DUF4180 domain-containing protein [Desulfosporosinus sp.]|uniref:DUF4180 domain-containing protein n=1 Tax=Desulfosporosinus sp. TaxID=157907 RepID=UPI00231371E6|nr:DUF4180 domain-containing protein [Desulfosporosinus sp.]MDA8223034.1 DUF4180 domain-containing protein [Desulfitobacterium hafniense]
MRIEILKENKLEVALVTSNEILLKDVQSALDLIATVGYETGCDFMILNKAAICEDFFELSTKMAGDILQKFVNYHMKIAILGDFSSYKSKSLKDFIDECNKGKNIFFLNNEKQAIERFAMINAAN